MISPPSATLRPRSPSGTGASALHAAAVLHVLVIDDSERARAMVVLALAREGCVVHEASDSAAARRYISTRPPDVVVLDLSLRDGGGLDLLRELVGAGTAVVVLTERGDEVDRVLGLELGADDYVVKPFFPRELAIRVRRAAGRGQSSRPEPIDVGGLVIDRDTREVFLHGTSVALTDREFDLLVRLAASPRRVFSRDELLRDVWHSSPEWQSAKTVTEHVRRLRRKLEPDPGRPRLIVTVGTAGYRLEPAPDHDST